MPRGSMASRSGLTPMANSFLQNRQMESQLAFTEKLIQLESLKDNRKIRELQYDTALFNLEEAKEEARRKRESAKSISVLQQEYDSVLNSDLSGRQKRAEVGRLGVKFSGIMALDPAARLLHDAAASSITMDPREEEPALTVDRYVREGGDPAYLENVLGDTMYDENTVIPPQAFYEGITSTKRQLYKSKAQLEAEAEQSQRTKDLAKAVLSAELEEAEKAFDGSIKTPAKIKGAGNVDALLKSAYPQEDISSWSAEKRLSAAQDLAGQIIAPRPQSQPSTTTAAPSLRSLWGLE